VDEFFGRNEGLILAEIELSSEEETYMKPSWVGEEVTNDQRYYNSYLAVNPVSTWK
jgi:adenylate cyclase